MVQIITGKIGKEELLEWCVGYSKKETTERIALVDCIEQFIVQGLPTSQVDATILSIVMQSFDDEHYLVRKKSCNCLALLIDTKYRDLAARKLCEAAIDPSHYVRSQVLNLCKSKKIQIPEILLTPIHNEHIIPFKADWSEIFPTQLPICFIQWLYP